MCQLFESIKVYRRKIYNLYFHEARINRSRAELWRINEPIALKQKLTIPDGVGDGLYKCRVTYGPEVQKVEFSPYRAKPLQTLKIVYNNDAIYNYKYQNRQVLVDLWNQRGKCDDVLIIKNDRITDTSYCNVICWDGQKWCTPAQPLLPGTQRAFLLQQGTIEEEDIQLKDLAKFKKVKLINALLDFEQAPVIPTCCIF